MLAKDIMTAEVLCLDPDQEVDDIARQFLARRISAAPVTDRDGRLLGIVSEGDLMRRAGFGSERCWWLSAFADRTADFTRTMGTRARDVMTREVVTVSENAPLFEIAHILETHRIKRVPVVKGDHVIGVVSRADLLRALAAVGSHRAEATADDRAIREQILGLLRQDTSVALQAISIIVVRGSVYLWGTAETQADKDAVRVAAENVVGTDKVHNFLNTLTEVLRSVG